MSDRYATVGVTVLGQAVDPVSGSTLRVVATKHANRLPGFQDENCFAVEKFDGRGNVIAAWGFTSPQDCFHFLSNAGEHGYQVPDFRGDMVEDVRTGFGIPDGLIRVFNSAGTSAPSATNATNV